VSSDSGLLGASWRCQSNEIKQNRNPEEEQKHQKRSCRIEPLLLRNATKYFFKFLFRNLVKPSEMPRPLALTGITAHTHKNTLHQVTKHIKRNIYI